MYFRDLNDREKSLFNDKQKCFYWLLIRRFLAKCFRCKQNKWQINQTWHTDFIVMNRVFVQLLESLRFIYQSAINRQERHIQIDSCRHIKFVILIVYACLQSFVTHRRQPKMKLSRMNNEIDLFNLFYCLLNQRQREWNKQSS